MTELPNWVAPIVEVLAYVFFGPPLVFYAVVVGFMVVVVAIMHPIWGAIFGRSVDGPLDSNTRIVIGLVGLGLLWQMIAPWL